MHGLFCYIRFGDKEDTTVKNQDPTRIKPKDKSNKNDLVSMSFRVPKVLAENLRAYSNLQSNRSQNDVGVEALSGFLRSKGMKPELSPTIVITWDEKE